MVSEAQIMEQTRYENSETYVKHAVSQIQRHKVTQKLTNVVIIIIIIIIVINIMYTIKSNNKYAHFCLYN